MELKKKSFKDINLKEYKQIVKIYARELDSDLEKDISVLSVLMGIDESEIYSLPITELKYLLNQMEWIKHYEFKPTKFKHNKIIIDGNEYIVNPNIDDFTVSQYMDFQNFWDNKEERMGNLLAVFIIPKGHKYNEGYDAIELADKLEEVLSIDDWNNVCFFFLKNSWISTKAMLLFSVWKMKKMIRKTKNKQEKEILIQQRNQLLQQIRLMD